MLDIEKYIEENKKLINNFLLAHFNKRYDKKLPNNRFSLNDAMFYTLSIGGKRIRPIFLLITAESLGFTEKDRLLPFASSIELIHSYSLIHDDLPVMDNDSLRRGKPTNHLVFGEAAAILAGDALLSEAFVILTDKQYTAGFDYRIIVNIVNELSFSSGAGGLVGGQFFDIMSPETDLRLEEITEIHTGKTASLIAAACVMGGMLAGANENIISSLKNYGRYIGLAFQAIDDLLDITGNSRFTGKTAGIDKNNKKSTIVSVLGIEKTNELIKKYTDNAVIWLDETGIGFPMLKNLSYYLINRVC